MIDPIVLPLGLTALLSVFAPVVIRIAKRWIVSPQERTMFAWGLSAATGIIAAVWFGYAPTWGNIIPFILAAHGASQAAWATWRGFTQ